MSGTYVAAMLSKPKKTQSLVNDIADVSVLSFQGLKRTLGTNICRNL